MQPSAPCDVVQQEQQPSRSSTAAEVFIHTLIPSQLLKNHPPFLSISCTTLDNDNSNARKPPQQHQQQEHTPSITLVEGVPAHLVVPGPELTYFCYSLVPSEVLIPAPESSSSSSNTCSTGRRSMAAAEVSLTATITLQLPKQGVLRRSRQLQLQHQLLPRLCNHFVLQPLAPDGSQSQEGSGGSGAGAGPFDRPALLAAMASSLVQQLQQPEQLPAIVQQLHDLALHCMSDRPPSQVTISMTYCKDL